MKEARGQRPGDILLRKAQRPVNGFNLEDEYQPWRSVSGNKIPFEQKAEVRWHAQMLNLFISTMISELKCFSTGILDGYRYRDLTF